MAITRPIIILKNESVIYNPNPDCEYQLVLEKFSQAQISVTFAGSECEKPVWVDLPGMQYLLKGEPIRSYIPKYPVIVPDQSGLPLLWFEAPNKLYVMTSVHFIYEKNNMVHVQQYGWTQDSLTLSTENEILRIQCTKLLKNIPVRIPKFPIAIPKEKPSRETLHALFKRFLKFNNDEKLQEQYDQTESLCHIRAHFIGTLLEMCGIMSFKVFKCWNPLDWKLIRNDDFMWSDHCAAGIQDAENNIWIWDPWVNLHHKLLTLPEWVYQKNEPKVTEVIIVNRTIVNRVNKENDFYCSRFSLFFPEYIKAFQALCGSALPFSKHLRRLSLFQANPERALIPYVPRRRFF